MIEMSSAGFLLVLVALLGSVFWVFGRVRQNYRVHGKLTPSVTFLQTGFFVVYALCSFVFLDSRLSQIRADGALFLLSCGLMLVGFTVVILSMPFLGRVSFGGEVGRLRMEGLYRYSRNPQLVGGFLFMLGYASLWPSWQGFAWVAIWLVISPLMVRGEEEHLARVFGKIYLDYCERVPRYIGRIR
jgi:protein-S-isoprenylcysteine O-methyltransferase Ste14